MENYSRFQYFRTRMVVQENLKLVDLIIEVADARIPKSSRDTGLNKIVKSKPRLLVLTKKDLADAARTAQWVHAYRKEGLLAVAVNNLDKKDIKRLFAVLATYVKPCHRTAVNPGKPLRAMVVGYPNVGKSSLINGLLGRKAALTGAKPGITRGKQWFRLRADLELLDTPGVLEINKHDPANRFKLAVTGLMETGTYDAQDEALNLISWLLKAAPSTIHERYGIQEQTDPDPDTFLVKIGRQRGYLVANGLADREQTARMLLQEFNKGLLGNYTLDDL